VAGELWLEAVPVLRILAIAMWARPIVVLTGQMLDAVGQPAQTLRLNAVRLAVPGALLPALAAWSGLNGVAQAVLLANGAAALFATRLFMRT
jgi:O-antigen/teichoic acid export membrane protein